jgi:hypothetical protein
MYSIKGKQHALVVLGIILKTRHVSTAWVRAVCVGGMFTQELSKRNTFLLYALAAAPSCDEHTCSKVSAVESSASFMSVYAQWGSGCMVCSTGQQDMLCF